MFKKIIRNTYFHITIILFISLLIRIVLISKSGPKIDNDTPLYLEQIYNLYDGKGFCIEDYVDNKLKPTAYRAPLFQYLSVLISKTLNIKKENIILVIGWMNFTFSILTVLLSMIIAYIMTKQKKIYILTGYITAINLNLIYNSVLVLTDTTFAFVIGIFILITTLSLKHQSKKYLFLISGVVLGLSVMTRTITKFYFLIHIIFLFFILNHNKSEKIKIISIFLLGYLSIISPWIIRNYQKLDFLGIETNQGLNTIWSVSNLVEIKKNDYKDKEIYEIKKIIIEDRKNHPWPMGAEIEARKKLKLTEVESSKYFQKIGMETILTHPFEFFKIFIRNLMNNITSSTSEIKLIDLFYPGYYDKQHNIMTKFENIENPHQDKKIYIKDILMILPNFIFRIIHLMIFFISIYGAYLLFKKDRISSIFISIFILYLLTLTSAVASYDRYRLPFGILLCLLVSYAAVNLFKKPDTLDNREQ